MVTIMRNGALLTGNLFVENLLPLLALKTYFNVKHRFMIYLYPHQSKSEFWKYLIWVFRHFRHQHFGIDLRETTAH